MHTGKQPPRCNLCGWAFGLTPENAVLTEESRVRIERLLRESLSRRGICRVVGVGRQWR